MARVLQKFFQVHGRVAEGGTGFGLGHLHCVDQGSLGVHNAHAASAATARRLDDHRITNGFGDAADLRRILGQFPFRTRHAGHARPDHCLLGRHFVAHDADRLGCGANELEAALFNALGKSRVFAQKPVAGMDRLSVGDFSG